MSSPPHLFVDISSHGFGHLAQVAPVLDALAERRPGLALTIRSGLPYDSLRRRLKPAFRHIAASSDFGYPMHDAVRIDLLATAAKYRRQHENWEAQVAAEAALLASLRPRLVLTDVAYLPLAGAAQAGIPAMAMSSLNWADLFAHYFGAEDWAASIHRQMLAAYRSAECFLRLTPGMPMSDLPRVRVVGPVAALGTDVRAVLRERLGCTQDERLVLIAFGGFDKRLPVERWPRIDGVRWLLPGTWRIEQPAMHAIEPLGYPFADLLRSVDAVLTKPGYGTFAEAACNGTRVLYVRRDDWPEQDCLIEWLATHGCCRQVEESNLLSGCLADTLSSLFAQAVPSPPLPHGAMQIAKLLQHKLEAPEQPGRFK